MKITTRGGGYCSRIVYRKEDFIRLLHMSSFIKLRIKGVSVSQVVIAREFPGALSNEARFYYIPQQGMFVTDLPFVEVFLPLGKTGRHTFMALDEAGEQLASIIDNKDKGKSIYKLVFTSDWIEVYKTTTVTWAEVEKLLSSALESIPGAESLEFEHATTIANVRNLEMARR